MEQNIYFENEQGRSPKKRTGQIVAIISGLVLIILITMGVSYYVIGQVITENQTEVANRQKQAEKSEKKERYFEEVSIEDAAKFAETKDVAVVIGKGSCSHCKMYKPKIKQLAYDKKFKVYYVDLDVKGNRESFNKYSKLQVEGTPTTLFFHNGKVVGEVIGDAASENIEETLEDVKQQGFQIS